eukprot:scaffold276_cov116-Isochrysis_galbana.AAC.16
MVAAALSSRAERADEMKMCARRVTICAARVYRELDLISRSWRPSRRKRPIREATAPCTVTVCSPARRRCITKSRKRASASLSSSTRRVRRYLFFCCNVTTGRVCSACCPNLHSQKRSSLSCRLTIRSCSISSFRSCQRSETARLTARKFSCCDSRFRRRASSDRLSSCVRSSGTIRSRSIRTSTRRRAVRPPAASYAVSSSDLSRC